MVNKPKTNKKGSKSYGKRKSFNGNKEIRDKRTSVKEDSDVRKNSTLSNDPEFYVTDATLLANSTQFNKWINYGYARRVRTGDGLVDVSVPTMYRLLLNPSAGVTVEMPYGLSSKFGINRAAQNLWNGLAAYSGRAQNYEPSDVGMAILGAGSIVSMISHIKLIFNVANITNVYNADMPIALFGAIGIDYEDFRDNLRSYESRFIGLISAFNAMIKLPGSIPYFKKCWQVYYNIYADRDVANAQLIIPVPYSVWELDEISSQDGSVLKTVRIPVTLKRMGVVLDILEDQINAFQNSATFGYIWTDMMNYASKKDVEMLQVPTELYDGIAHIGYDHVFDGMFENAKFVGAPRTTGIIDTTVGHTPNNDIVTRNGHIIYFPEFEATKATDFLDHVLNFHGNDINDDNYKVDATRLTAMVGCTTLIDGKYFNSDINSTILPSFYPVSLYVYDRGNYMGNYSTYEYDSASGLANYILHTGPIANAPIVYYKISSSGARFTTANYDQAAVWSSERMIQAQELYDMGLFSFQA